MKRRQFMSLVGGAALSPLAGMPVTAEPGSCPAPAPVASSIESLVDVAALCRMTDRLAASANVHAVLVARAGKLVFERYLTGSDEINDRPIANATFDADTLHDMKSVSKSVASLALGIAIDRGLIAGVDQPIFSFFPELSDLRSPEKDRILLSHALTMSMGLKWVEATPSTGNFDNDESRMHMARDPCRYVLGLPLVAPAGQDFFYNTGALTLVSAIIRKAVGKPLDEFAREALFEPLGITRFEWTRVKGDTDAGGGLRLRPRDMVKIGQLVLAGGRWDDRQIVSKAWIDASTRPRLEATGPYFYGYLWWLGRSLHGGREIHWDAALGRGGQSIRIVPELDLVVAVTAGYYQDYSARAFQLQSGIFKDVLRAIPAAG
ncbi:MAG: class C beta-lactamase-related serine hydrolase [Bradyrhizobiaceae bacterium]|nr:MAG: class C beta-lactamase-related serine hydrolase [Bradyrhizobiaceae bacterium]